MLDLADEPSFIESKEDEIMRSQGPSRRGRRRVPFMWTRIMKIETLKRIGDVADEEEVEIFEIEEDAKHEYEVPTSLLKKSKKLWKPLFEPKEYWRAHEDKTIESNELSKRQLKSLAKNATELRSIFIERAKDYS